MKKIAVLAVAAIVCLPSLVHADLFSLRGGYFLPRASTSNPDSLWSIELSQMTFKRENFNAGIFGASYEFFVNKYVSLALTGDTYSRDRAGSYLDFLGITVDNEDFAFSTADITGDFTISHVFRVSSTPLQASIKLYPMGRRSRVIPYVGGGVGLYFWRVAIRGEAIDFSQPTDFVDNLGNPITGFPIFFSETRESGTSFGEHAFAGFMVPLGYRVTVEFEGRYHFAKAELTKAFEGFPPFDLNGLALSVGFNYWF